MKRFAPALRRVVRELDLPRGVRAEIVLEMAADLDAAFRHHLRRGADEDEAQRRAEEAVLGSSEVIRRLVRLHRAQGARWSEEIGSRFGGGADRFVLLAGVLPMLALAGVAAGRSLASGGGLLGWPLLAMGVLIAAMVVRGFRRTASDGGPHVRRGLTGLLVASAAAPALGLLALTAGLRSIAAELAAATPDSAARIEPLAHLGSDGALLAAGLLLGIAGALAWFVLCARASAAVEREVEALLAGNGDPAAADVRGAGGASGSDNVIPLVRRRRA